MPVPMAAVVLSLILLIWFIIRMNDIVNELRIQNRQQALLLAIKKRESHIPFDDQLHADFEKFYTMKKGKVLD